MKKIIFSAMALMIGAIGFGQWSNEATIMQTAISKTLWNNPVDATVWLISAWFNVLGFDNVAKEISKYTVSDISKKTLWYTYTTEYGEFDNIAPLKEAKKIGDDLSQAKFIVVKEMGHLPFLKEDFGEYIKWLIKKL